jgi:hypothetical protein
MKKKRAGITKSDGKNTYDRFKERKSFQYLIVQEV